MYINSPKVINGVFAPGLVRFRKGQVTLVDTFNFDEFSEVYAVNVNNLWDFANYTYPEIFESNFLYKEYLLDLLSKAGLETPYHKPFKLEDCV